MPQDRQALPLLHCLRRPSHLAHSTCQRWPIRKLSDTRSHSVLLTSAVFRRTHSVASTLHERPDFSLRPSNVTRCRENRRRISSRTSRPRWRGLQHFAFSSLTHSGASLVRVSRIAARGTRAHRVAMSGRSRPRPQGQRRLPLAGGCSLPHLGSRHPDVITMKAVAGLESLVATTTRAATLRRHGC